MIVKPLDLDRARQVADDIPGLPSELLATAIDEIESLREFVEEAAGPSLTIEDAAGRRHHVYPYAGQGDPVAALTRRVDDIENRLQPRAAYGERVNLDVLSAVLTRLERLERLSLVHHQGA